MTQRPHPSPQVLLAQAGLRAKKAWGQNFLRDQRVLGRITDAIGAGPNQPVIELGAGLGALTYHLLKRGGHVIAIERDRDLVPLLRDSLGWAKERLEIRETDAACLDYHALLQSMGALPNNGAPFDPGLRIVGNLPYQLSSRILVHLTECATKTVTHAVVMVQREVGARLGAESGTRAYGLLTVLVRRRFDVRQVCTVPPSAFLPQPKVDSVVVHLRAHGNALDPVHDKSLVRTARAAFSCRRKTLRNSLKNGLHGSVFTQEHLTQVIEAAHIDPQRRPETLTLDEFTTLSQGLNLAGLLGDT